MMFQCSNCNIVILFNYKILNVFINVYDIHYILLYVGINILIFICCKKTR
jgi:hypothetical protein